MSRLFSNIAQLVSPGGMGPRRGAQMGELDIIHDAAFLVQGGRIAWLGERDQAPATHAEPVDLGGRAVVPGLTDPHTHAVWAGERLADFDARARGLGYEEILQQGGGIRSTMRATAAASVPELVSLARPRIQRLIDSGATTIEIKSGYGYTAEAELAMLEAIRELQAGTGARLVATLLIHVPPQHATERSDYLDMVTQELVPEVARRGLASAVDVFTEKEAFDLRETERILQAAAGRGLAVKLHADQFHAIGGTELAIAYRALSVDHLEASGDGQLRALAASGTVATLLPGVSLHLGLPGARGRELVDAGAAVAVGTDLNPGSSPLCSTALVQALAVRLNGLSPAEALTAGTVNAAAALGIRDHGRLRAGSPADFLVLAGSDWRQLSYDLSGQAVAETWIGGHRRDSR